MKKEIITITIIKEKIGKSGEGVEYEIKGKLTRFAKEVLLNELLRGEKIERLTLRPKLFNLTPVFSKRG